MPLMRQIAQSRHIPPAFLRAARPYGVRAWLGRKTVQHFRGIMMVQGLLSQAHIGSHQARNPSLAVCGPRKSCGGAVLGRLGVVSDDLCQLRHCCTKGSQWPPTGLLGRAAMCVCRVSSWRFDIGCRRPRLGHSHNHILIDWECLADFLTHNASRKAE